MYKLTITAVSEKQSRNSKAEDGAFTPTVTEKIRHDKDSSNNGNGVYEVKINKKIISPPVKDPKTSTAIYSIKRELTKQ